MPKKRVEDLQRGQLIQYHKQVLKLQYPDLILLVIENNGYKSIVTERSHPDCLWCIPHNNERYWLYHELKKDGGKLDKNQKIWWNKFKETATTQGIVTCGLQAHFDGIDSWIATILNKPQ